MTVTVLRLRLVNGSWRNKKVRSSICVVFWHRCLCVANVQSINMFQSHARPSLIAL